MRKNVLFLLVAFVATVFVTSCGKENKCTIAEAGSAGTYYGSHLVAGILTVPDTLVVSEGTAGDGKITVQSSQLGTSFEATINEANCRYEIAPITIDSMAISGITLRDIEADGYATKDGNTIKTTINVNKGSVEGVPALSNLKGQKLQGTFKR